MIFWGEMDTTLTVLVIMKVIDYITRVLIAGYKGESKSKSKSKVGFKGITKNVDRGEHDMHVIHV